jgi:hypothetical protein
MVLALRHEFHWHVRHFRAYCSRAPEPFFQDGWLTLPLPKILDFPLPGLQ